MTGSSPLIPITAIERARRFAALSGVFDPRDALAVAEDITADNSGLVAVASQLASACDTGLPGDRPAWLMRGPERKWELEALAERMAISEAVAWRRQAAATAADTLDLLDALVGAGLFDDRSIQSRIEAGGPRRELERIAVALDRAGRLAPARDRLDAVRAALTRLATEERNRALLGLGGLPPGGSGPWQLAPEPTEPIEGLAALGLFAEWAGAAAFVLRDPDLTLLARGAERWRRTTAGQWSYDRTPAAWKEWDRPLDVTLAARVAALAAAADPAEESHRQLEAWSGDDRSGAPALWDQILRRRPGALNAARAAADASGAARTLLRHQVPSAFIPPLAVLLARRKF